MNKLIKLLSAILLTATMASSIEVVFVEAGKFTTSGGTQTGYTNGVEVTLTQDFWIGKYPVTQAQYQAIMGNNPSSFSGRPNNPVGQVSWNEAVAFATAVGGFLPTEAQWEFAARGGNLSKGFIYSGSNNIDEVAWYVSNSNSTQRVGQKKPNELGIYDMSGNVWEWTADWHQITYPSSSTNPTGALMGSDRVIRGGGWYDDAEYCRVAFRGRSWPDNGSSHLGFRVAFNSHSFELKKVRYEKNNGSAAYIVEVVGDTPTITRPADPTKTDHIFVAWYKDVKFENVWDFANDKVESDITLYAKWKLDVAVEVETYTYNGEQFKPLPRVQLRDSKTLLQNSIDYTLSYGENINAGNGSVRIMGTEKYALLDTTVNFTINKRTIEVNWSDRWTTYDGTEKTPTATTTDELFPISDVSGGGKINAGCYTASVTLLNPDTNVVLDNAVIIFCINKATYQSNVFLSDIVFLTPHRPSVSNNPENGRVNYYFSTEKYRDYIPLPNHVLLPGRYWLYAEISATENYGTVRTDTISFRVVEHEDDLSSILDSKGKPKHGIAFENSITTSDKTAKFVISTPEQSQITLSIFDNLGNLLNTQTLRTDRNGEVKGEWDLTNEAGRFVANGTYLVIAEVKDRNGRTYTYSARLGVKR